MEKVEKLRKVREKNILFFLKGNQQIVQHYVEKSEKFFCMKRQSI